MVLTCFNRIKPLLTAIKPALNQHFPYFHMGCAVVSNTATLDLIESEVEGWLSKRAQDMGKAAIFCVGSWTTLW